MMKFSFCSHLLLFLERSNNTQNSLRITFYRIPSYYCWNVIKHDWNNVSSRKKGDNNFKAEKSVRIQKPWWKSYWLKNVFFTKNNVQELWKDLDSQMLLPKIDWLIWVSVHQHYHHHPKRRTGTNGENTITLSSYKRDEKRCVN